MTAPAGTEVGLYVDLSADVVVGDIVETQTGRRYLVTVRRTQLTGKHVGRQHLRCVVLDLAVHAIAPGTVIHRIRWYKRGRGRR